jgi:hypothetical protein
MTNDKIREAFESAYISDYEGDLTKYADGDYVDDTLQDKWEVWQKAAISAIKQKIGEIT